MKTLAEQFLKVQVFFFAVPDMRHPVFPCQLKPPTSSVV